MFDTKNCLAFATATLLEMFDTKNCLAFEAYEDQNLLIIESFWIETKSFKPSHFENGFFK